MAITIKDVAKKAHVSVATVSRVVNNVQMEKVGAKTRDRVKKIVSRLDYRPNLTARSLSKKMTSHIGIVLPFSQGLFGNQYYTELLQGIMIEVNKAKFALTLYDTFVIGGDIASPIKEGQVDGLLIVSPTEEQLKSTKQHKKRIVAINAFYPDLKFSYVDCDNKQGVKDLVDKLVSLGHTRIACISGPKESSNAKDRLDGYKKALKDNGIKIDENFLLDGGFVYDRGFVAAKKLLELKPRPTAIFCSNDTMAIASLRAALNEGLKVPDDVSIAGFDDIETVRFVHPSITTIRQPILKIGKESTRVLLEQIESKTYRAKSVILPTEVILRESCRSIK